MLYLYIHYIQDLKVTDHSKIDKILNGASLDKTNFTSLVYNLDILRHNESNPKFTPKEIMDSTIQKFRKYKKELSIVYQFIYLT